jgi:hypothetical protein
MIPPEELARLAVFYDRFANHLDPLGDDWKRRKQEYFQCLNEIHGRFAAGIGFDEFRREAQRSCFRWLRAQNKPLRRRRKHESDDALPTNVVRRPLAVDEPPHFSGWIFVAQRRRQAVRTDVVKALEHCKPPQ